MKQLIAIRVGDPDRAAQILNDVWVDGHASLVLDPTGPTTHAAQLLQSIEPDAIVHDTPDGSRSRIRRLPGGAMGRLPADTATVVATSGSTGAPRVIILTEEAIRAATTASLDRLSCRAPSRWLLALPLHHVAGQLVLRRAAALGTAAEIVGRLTAPAAAQLESTYWALVPTMLQRLVAAESDLRGRTILLGGAPASDQLVGAARALGAEVVTSYGMTETSGGCVYDGTPLDGVEVSIDLTGRIRLRGPVVTAGELSETGVRPLIDEDGWLTTNDLGSMVDGRLVVDGRADAVIISGGENVAAEPIERCLRLAEGVDDVVVIGIPDDEWGQIVVALVETSGGTTLDSEALRRSVADGVGPRSVPKRILRVEALPRTSLGKPARAEATAMAARMLSAPTEDG